MRTDTKFRNARNASMLMRYCLLIAALVLFVNSLGSRAVAQNEPQGEFKRANREEAQAITDSLKRAMKDFDYMPIIKFPNPPDWKHGEIVKLPPEERGFSVRYSHKSGLTCTFYQHRRELASISDGMKSPAIQKAIERSKDEVAEVIKRGRAESAKEIRSELVKLGDSNEPAHWSQYQLVIKGKPVVSDLYIWTRSDCILKLRCTSNDPTSTSNDPLLKPLLSALGKAPKAELKPLKLDINLGPKR